MDIVNIVVGVIEKAINSYSIRKGIDSNSVQISLFLETNGNTGVKFLENYRVAEDARLSSLLGSYSIMRGVVGSKISGSLKKFAKQTEISDYEISAMLFYKDGKIICWLYGKGQPIKEIKVEDIV